MDDRLNTTPGCKDPNALGTVKETAAAVAKEGVGTNEEEEMGEDGVGTGEEEETGMEGIIEAYPIKCVKNQQ